MLVSLRDGLVAVNVQLGASGQLDAEVRPPTNVRFDDNGWHHVVVARQASEVSGIPDLCLLGYTRERPTILKPFLFWPFLLPYLPRKRSSRPNFFSSSGETFFTVSMLRKRLFHLKICFTVWLLAGKCSPVSLFTLRLSFFA